MDWLGALVASGKPVEGVDVGPQLPDCKHQPCDDAGGEEEEHEEGVQSKQWLPAIGAQRPAQQAPAAESTRALAHGFTNIVTCICRPQMWPCYVAVHCVLCNKHRRFTLPAALKLLRVAF